MQRNQNGSRGSLILKSAISRPGSGIALLCGFLLLLGILQLNHAYNGIFHDARLYLLQAIARSHPDSLTHDLFLSFGSQDRYTLFSGPYAAFIALAGIPLAAALGTALSQCALVLSGWVLARALMADRLALVGIVGFVALPGFYGPGHVFSVIEGFLTPRMLAEALVLLSLAALLKARYATGSVALIMAALVHPIIAAAGVICVTSWFCIHGQLLQRMRKILFFTFAFLVVALYIVVGIQTQRFDEIWWTLVTTRSPYLVMQSWTVDDIAQLSTSLGVLGTGFLVSQRPLLRHLCAVVCITALSGLLMTFIGCDWLHSVLVTQIQPWRWQWLAAATAALLLPAIVIEAWQRGENGKGVSLLLVAMMIFGSVLPGLSVAVLCVTYALVLRLRPIEGSKARLFNYGAAVLVAIASAWRLGSNLEFTGAFFLSGSIALWLRKMMSFAQDGSIALGFACLIVGLDQGPRTRRLLWPTGVALLLVNIMMLPESMKSWSKNDYPNSQYQQLQPLRDAIPRAAQVLWAGQSADSVWFLLNRPNYLSVTQTTGMLFSRPMALESARRARAIRQIVPERVFLDWEAADVLWLSVAQQQAICASGAIDYLVTPAELSQTVAVARVQPNSQASSGLKLSAYRCAKN